MYSKRFLFFGLTTLLALTVWACNKTPSAAPENAPASTDASAKAETAEAAPVAQPTVIPSSVEKNPIEGGQWNWTEAHPDAKVWLSFSDGKVSGHSGVNRFNGSYQLEGEKLSIPPTISTRMAGPPPLMDKEQEFLQKLSEVTAQRIVGERLHLVNGTGQTILEFTPGKQLTLESVQWRALSVNNGKGGVASLVRGSNITATFDGTGSVKGSAGCNSYGGSYEHKDGTIKIGPLRMTRKACLTPEGVMAQESAFAEALKQSVVYRIENNNMEFRSSKGSLQVMFTTDDQ